MLSDMRRASHVFYAHVSINQGLWKLMKTLLGGEKDGESL